MTLFLVAKRGGASAQKKKTKNPQRAIRALFCLLVTRKKKERHMGEASLLPFLGVGPGRHVVGSWRN